MSSIKMMLLNNLGANNFSSCISLKRLFVSTEMYKYNMRLPHNDIMLWPALWSLYTNVNSAGTVFTLQFSSLAKSGPKSIEITNHNVTWAGQEYKPTMTNEENNS